MYCSNNSNPCTSSCCCTRNSDNSNSSCRCPATATERNLVTQSRAVIPQLFSSGGAPPVRMLSQQQQQQHEHWKRLRLQQMKLMHIRRMQREVEDRQRQLQEELRQTQNLRPRLQQQQQQLRTVQLQRQDATASGLMQPLQGAAVVPSSSPSLESIQLRQQQLLQQQHQQLRHQQQQQQYLQQQLLQQQMQRQTSGLGTAGPSACSQPQRHLQQEVLFQQRQRQQLAEQRMLQAQQQQPVGHGSALQLERPEQSAFPSVARHWSMDSTTASAMQPAPGTAAAAAAYTPQTNHERLPRELPREQHSRQSRPTPLDAHRRLLQQQQDQQAQRQRLLLQQQTGQQPRLQSIQRQKQQQHQQWQKQQQTHQEYSPEQEISQALPLQPRQQQEDTQQQQRQMQQLQPLVTQQQVSYSLEQSPHAQHAQHSEPLADQQQRQEQAKEQQQQQKPQQQALQLQQLLQLDTPEPPRAPNTRANREDLPIQASAAAAFFQRLQEEDAMLRKEQQQQQQATQSSAQPSQQQQRLRLQHLRLGESSRSRTSLSVHRRAAAAADSDTPQQRQQQRVSQQPQKAAASRSTGLKLSSCASGGSTSYLPAESLEDFESPPGPRYVAEVLLPQLQQQSSKADWRQQTQALLDLRRIAKFHPHLLTQESTRRFASAALSLMGCPRSSLAKNAAIALSDLFASTRGRTDAAVSEVIDVCLKKSCQSVEFLAEAARAVLRSVCDFATEERTFTAFCAAAANAKHQGARCVGISCLAFLLDKYRRKPPDLTPLVELLLQASGEASSELRAASRAALWLLLDVVDASEWRAGGGTADQLRAARAVADKATQAEVADVLDSVSCCSF
ncbi:hypothetical protein Efla_006683 [Eimeria flavescens]